MGALHLEGLSGDDPELERGSWSCLSPGGSSSSLKLPARKRQRRLSSGSSSSSELDMGEVEEERSVNDMSLGESLLAHLKTERLRAAQEAWNWEAVTPTLALSITAADRQA